MNFYEKRDYLSISIFILIVLAFTYSARDVYDSIIVETLAAMIGAMAGYLIASFVTTKSEAFKAVVLAAVILVSGTFLYAINSSNTTANQLTGTYLIDSSEGFTIKLRAEADKAFLSTSPEFEETEYKPEIRNDSLYFFKGSELKFEWEILQLDEKKLVISSNGERLEFLKQE